MPGPNSQPMRYGNKGSGKTENDRKSGKHARHLHNKQVKSDQNKERAAGKSR